MTGSRRHLATLKLAGFFLLPAGTLFAQAGSAQLTPGESQTALDAAVNRLAAYEQTVKTLEAANVALGESLAAANAESVQYRVAYQEVRLQMEALGIEAVTPNSAGIEQRLLKAVRDNQLLEDENKALTEQLLRMAGVALGFAQTAVSSDPARLHMVKTEAQAVEQLLAKGAEAEATSVDGIAAASVVELADEFGLVVLNAGRGSGARVGMPLEVIRGNRTIGTGLIVDVRGSIAGLMVQRLTSELEPIEVGDRVRINTGQTF